MIPLGLSAADRKALTAQLGDNRRIRVHVAVTLLDNTASANLSNYFVDGHVDVDATQAVTSSATFNLTDPKRELPFDTNHPSETALFVDRMIRVHFEVFGEHLDDWIRIPRFTGPVTKLDRDGATVTVECQGKESLFMREAWKPFTLHKGMKKTDAIRRILHGENRFDFPEVNARLPKPYVLGRQSIPWVAARRIARSMGMQLFYDGRGVCRMRHSPTTVGFTFSGTKHVLTEPQIGFAGEDVVNAVYVLGAAPKGPKSQIHAEAVAPANHPLSPQRLGRAGVPRYLPKFVQDDSIKTLAEAKTLANRELATGLLQALTATFDSAPIPMLEPLDMCRVKTADIDMPFRVRQFTFPLTAGEGDGAAMSVGYGKRVPLTGVRRVNQP